MRLIQWWRSQPQSIRDGLGAAAFAAISLLPVLAPYGLVLGALPVRPADTLSVLLILAQTLPLAARRTAPGWALALVGVAFAVDQCLGYPPSPAGLGVLVALYSAGAHQRRARGVTVVTSAAAYVILAVVLLVLGSPEHVWDFVTFTLVLAAAWGVGDLVRLRTTAADARAADGARAAVTDERMRVARELHDVVGHHVTSMVVQADAASLLAASGQPLSSEQLAAIADGGRRALDDLRRLLDVLGSDDTARSPAIGALGDLVRAAQAAGQRITLEEEGMPVGTDELRLAVYRIVQEGLTNALKHAPGQPTRVQVAWSANEVQVRLTTESTGSRSHRRVIPGSGRGLPGLAERVRRLGGRLHAGPDSRGRFELAAHLPLTPEEARHDT
ncbi:hypothetical protein ET475_06100 [Microbacterium protaetiae]|uniref:histidine kinase n=1 Tax=Microbacterium protaetiae TaxID=2509458 RepID=A0A4V0YD62_9MICO|nr:histidine kinase [Microbacterium protaetiae]QAY59601.1 hypothetical protein ET475_06100 [Microbacterium protaetiae]